VRASKDQFLGYHSEWNLGSPGGWDYQRITQKIGKAVWKRLSEHFALGVALDFDHPLLHPVYGFLDMLEALHRQREGSNPGLIAVVAEEETLKDVVENKNLVAHLNDRKGLSAALIAPHEVESKNGRVCFKGQPISIIFMDFNTDVLLKLHRKCGLDPLIEAVREGRVINPRGTEPINSKSMFEVLTDSRKGHLFHQETIRRTPWTRQFFPRRTVGPEGEEIPDLVEWTRSNWHHLVLKPERGYSGKGVNVGGINQNVDNIITHALEEEDYIVQEKIPLNLWAEKMPELNRTDKNVVEKTYQTDFRCLFGHRTLFGFLGRYGGVPTNVGSGGGVQPLAVVRSKINIAEVTKKMNKAIMTMDYGEVLEVVEHQKKMAMDHQFTYLLGPIKIALRPRLITQGQIKALEGYCSGIWSDCLTLEKMWLSGELDLRLRFDPDELEIVQSQPWRGGPAIFASDGLFSFGAHVG
jgi:hypothetical protein